MYNLGVTVHVVHPSGFKTNIFPPGLKQRCNDVYNSRLNPDQETSYKDTLEDRKSAHVYYGNQQSYDKIIYSI